MGFKQQSADQQKKKAQKQRRNAQKQLKQAESHLKEHESEMTKFSEEKKLNEEQIDELMKKQIALQQKFEQARITWAKELNSVLNMGARHQNYQNKVYHAAITKHQNATLKLNEKLGKTEEDIQKLFTTNNELETKIAELERELAAAHDEIAKLGSQLERCEAELRHAEARIASAVLLVEAQCKAQCKANIRNKDLMIANLTSDDSSPSTAQKYKLESTLRHVDQQASISPSTSTSISPSTSRSPTPAMSPSSAQRYKLERASRSPCASPVVIMEANSPHVA